MIDRFFHAKKGASMNLLKYKGKRIRASDKSLVYRFSMATLLLLFVAIILLLNLKQLMRTDWEQFSLLDNHTDSDWCLCIGRFSVLPLLL